MKVFVWKSYGYISVYYFTEELKLSLIECLNQENVQVSYEEATWDYLLELVDDQVFSDSDIFEYGCRSVTIK